MSDMHECFGVQGVGDKVVICACVSRQMYEQLMHYARQEFIGEVQAFAAEYHHHRFEGGDVVVVDQLLDFLRPIHREANNGLGTT